MKGKRLLSLLLMSAMISASFGTMPVMAETAVMTEYIDERPEPVVYYDFENDALSDINATFTPGASIVSDSAKDSKVLYMNGTTGSYMEFAAPTDTSGSVLEEYTVSFDVKNNTTGNYFNFYMGDGTQLSAGRNYLGVKAADSILISTVDSSTEKKINLAAAGVQGNWAHFDVVVSDEITQVYVDNEYKGELSGYAMSAISPSVIRFGFSPWSADNYSNAYYDNIAVYDCALSQRAITGALVTPRPTESTDKLLFGMDFNNQDITTIAGKATLNGTLTYVPSNDSSYAASFDGSGNYISLTNADGTSLLAGKDEITITFHKLANTATSWWFYASPDSSTQQYQQEHYLGILDSGAQLTAERYNNSGSRNESPTYAYSSGAWQEVTLVIGKKRSTLYVDGVAVSEKEYDFTLSQMLGDNPIAYIGRANWGIGEWATGAIDDFAIFDFAPDVDLGNLSDVTQDIILPTADEETDGYSVTWESSDEATITSEGKVTIPAEGKKEVTLTATIEFGKHTLKKKFEAVVKSPGYYDFNLKVDNEKGVDIRPGMYGLFFEDINYAADGGLYAEMIENRSFEALKSNGSGGTTYDGLYGWSVQNSSISSAPLVIQSEGGLNENNTHYLMYQSSGSEAGFKNQAYDGIYMEEGKTYNVSVFAKKGTFDGRVLARIYADGEVAAETIIAESLSDEWTKYEAVITPEKTVRYADFVVSLDGEGTAYFDMVSCIPSDAVMGIFRPDLAEKLRAMNPGFLRFPGGCIIEGYNLANRYNWKDTVGSIEERKQNWSRWSCHTSVGLDDGFKHYNQTYGIGYYEYFLLCEYLNCAPVPVVNVGMACEYQSKETVPVYESDGVTYTTEFYQYIQDALDLIEFANGDATTTWGKVRCDMGHQEPFDLEMIGIGNEQWAIEGNQWYTRYEAFEEEIHKVYPDMRLIGTSGPSASGDLFDEAWSWIRNSAKENADFTYAVDEHYYMSPSWFLENDTRYDNYDRNVKVFAGEYAAHTTLASTSETKNNLESAIAEAAFMTGIERNADVVYMASYAPLFARLNYVQWAPDMIWFDDKNSYLTPTYHVQSMYANNNGDYTLKSSVEENTDKIYQSVSYDEISGDIIIKIANPYEYTQKAMLTLDDSFELTGKADVEVLTGVSKTAVNSIDEPNNVIPVKSEIDVYSGTNINLSPLSFTIIRVHTGSGFMSIINAEKTDDAVKYEIELSDKASKYDLYTALYNDNGKLTSVAKNQPMGEFSAHGDTEYVFKAMLWEKDTVKPITDVLRRIPGIKPTPTPTPTPTVEPTEIPTPEPTEEPTPEPTEDPYSHEPAYGDIPVVTLTGDITGISRDEYKDVVLTYKSSTEEFTSYAQIKWQGRSSVNQGYPKYNYSLKMFKDELHDSKLKMQFKEWPKAHNYCLKANWIDSTHARNIVSARLAAKIQKNPLPSGETGLIDGFPIHVYLNGEDQGIYTWNIPKKDWTFGIDKDNLDHIAFGAEQQKGACLFQNLSSSDSDWEIIEPEDYPDQAREKFNRMVAFVKDSTVEEYKANFDQYLDMDAMLNYYVMAHIIGHTDGYAKNMIMVTFDGQVWHPSLYDLDSTYGLHWTGKRIIGADALFNENSSDWAMYRTSSLWNKFEQAFGNEIYERYVELRANELSDENIIEEFEYFINGVGQELYDIDESVWENKSSKHKYIPSRDFRLEQIKTYLKDRQPYLEDFMQSLRTE